jgi:CDP-paratose 2-epimerase
MNIIITGGAGFIGSNVAKYYLSKNNSVVIFDNLSRIGSRNNLKWLTSLHNAPVLIKGRMDDCKSVSKLTPYVKSADLVVHLAAQVAVTSSIINPLGDFEINALGTIHLLELLRKNNCKAKIIYSSTNKVYGEMDNIEIKKLSTRYMYKDALNGISENQPLDFHSPYGCSKGSADQYVRDYARIYGLDTTVLRQSCIYGPRQFGIEDQGWVAWFIIAILTKKPITIYGDGYQVRDILHIDDLVSLYDLVYKNSKVTRGEVYNVGGGMENTISVWREFGPILERLCRHTIPVTYKEVRKGDQKVYVSDIRKIRKAINWKPEIPVEKGISSLFHWLNENIELFNL